MKQSSHVRRLIHYSSAFLVIASVAVALTVGTVHATPSSGVTGGILTQGALPAAVATSLQPLSSGDLAGMGGMPTGTTAGTQTPVRVVQIAKFVAAPGGHFGWHQHSGPIWIVISSGTLTLYGGEDASCTPSVFPTGSAFLDTGNHTHIARNESSDPLEVYAVYMLPEGGAPRIDVDDPGNCSF